MSGGFCDVCGKPTQAVPSNPNRFRRTCSEECLGKLRTMNARKSPLRLMTYSKKYKLPSDMGNSRKEISYE